MRQSLSALAWCCAGCLIVGNGLAQTPLYFGGGDALPYAIDLNGDGRAELALFDSRAGTLSARVVGNDERAHDVLVAREGFAAAFGDYDGDGKIDPTSYDHVSGAWYSFASGRHYDLEIFQGAAGLETTIPVGADYDGDGRTDPALYDPTLGVWVVYPAILAYQPVVFQHLSGPACVPVPADYDGDGKADPAVYDEDTGTWMAYLSGSGHAAASLIHGGPGCVPAPADYDGDGKADPAVYHAALGVWGVLYSSANYAPDIVVQGGPGCLPVPGKYYYANRADFAVYNPTNGGWTIAYQSPLDADAFQNYVAAVLPSLLTGDWRGAAVGGIGWGLNLIFNHGKNPEDPHWAEMRGILSEMNGKLDQLLALSQTVLSELNKLSLQLKYESARTRQLISELLARQAFATVGSLYDSSGPEGYKHFYNCNTNNPPAPQTVESFVNKVLSRNMPECILQIQHAIQPVLATEQGVLRQWVDIAKMNGVTPDNLVDHYRALFAYFSTLYTYQVKAGVLYADAMRQRYTNDVDKLGIQAWITNDFRGMLRAGVDEFRLATYELVSAAIVAADIPNNLANPLEVPNVNEALATLEFFAFKWLAQPTTLCVTFLTVDRPATLEKYNSLICRQWQPDGRLIPRRTVSGTHVRGRPYGFKSPDIKHIAVNDRYVFTRVDYDKSKLSPEVRLSGDGYQSPRIPIWRYDDNMQATNAGNNIFAHFYCSPWNHELLALPTDAAAAADWRAGAHESVHYPNGAPGHGALRFDWLNKSDANGLHFSLICELNYDVAPRQANRPPASFGVQPWLFAYSYPFTVSNMTDRPIGVRGHVAHNNTYVSGQRWDDTGRYTDYVQRQKHQKWYFAGGGTAWFADSNARSYWNRGTSWLEHPAGQARREGREFRWSENNIVARRDAPLPAQAGIPLRMGVGARMELMQNCYRDGGTGSAWQGAHAWAWVDFRVSQVTISFY